MGNESDLNNFQPAEMAQGIGKIAEALGKAQRAFGIIPRNRTVTVRTKSGGIYQFSYAPLETILAHVSKPLADNGLALTQTIIHDGEKSSVRTILVHVSGALLTCDVPILVIESGPQAYGSGLTYARRYGVTLVLCLAADDDDDANSAQGNEIEQVKKKERERGSVSLGAVSPSASPYRGHEQASSSAVPPPEEGGGNEPGSPRQAPASPSSLRAGLKKGDLAFFEQMEIQKKRNEQEYYRVLKEHGFHTRKEIPTPKRELMLTLITSSLDALAEREARASLDAMDAETAARESENAIWENPSVIETCQRVEQLTGVTPKVVTDYLNRSLSGVLKLDRVLRLLDTCMVLGQKNKGKLIATLTGKS